MIDQSIIAQYIFRVALPYCDIFVSVFCSIQVQLHSRIVHGITIQHASNWHGITANQTIHNGSGQRNDTGIASVYYLSELDHYPTDESRSLGAVGVTPYTNSAILMEDDTSEGWHMGQPKDVEYWDLDDDDIPDPDPATLESQMAMVAPGRRRLRPKVSANETSDNGQSGVDNGKGADHSAVGRWAGGTGEEADDGKKTGHYVLKEPTNKKKLFVRNVSFKVCSNLVLLLYLCLTTRRERASNDGEYHTFMSHRECYISDTTHPYIVLLSSLSLRKPVIHLL